MGCIHATPTKVKPDLVLAGRAKSAAVARSESGTRYQQQAPQGRAEHAAVATARNTPPSPPLLLLEAHTKFDAEYKLSNTLGKGSFGMVLAACERASGRVDAVKIIDTSKGGHGLKVDDRKQKLAEHEIDVWAAVGRHPNVVGLRRAFSGNQCVLMVMERCECTVAEMVDDSPKILSSGLPRLLHQMLLGVEACHQALVVHRDIKPDNYLVGLDGRTVKLCDFNLSAQLTSGRRLTGEFGTPPFMSPEMLKAMSYDTATDVWSYGSMAYFMLFGELPYIPEEVSSKAAKAVIRCGVPRPRYLLNGASKKQGSEAVDLCQGLLQRDPKYRCTAQAALEHAYFQAMTEVTKHPACTDTQSTLDPLDLDLAVSDQSEVDPEEEGWESNEEMSDDDDA